MKGLGSEPIGERGAVSAMVAILSLAIFLALALVVDGGRALGALTEAQDIADNTARAGSRSVDLDQWRSTGRPVIDRDGVADQVSQFMADSQLDQRIEGWAVVEPVGPEAEVTVAVEVTLTPRRFFFPERTVTAIGTASALDGVAGP